MNGYSTPRGFMPAVVMHWLLVVVLLALLTAILLPMVFDGRQRGEERARLAGLLRDAATRQERWHAAHGGYGGSPSAVGVDDPALQDWRADSTGWSAVARSGYVLRPRVVCGIYLGNDEMRPDAAVPQAGQVGCWGWKFWMRHREPAP